MMTRIAQQLATIALLLLLAASSGAFVQDTNAPAPRSFAVLGDFGSDSENQAAVVDLIKKTLEPDFIVTVGDNNYGELTNEGYERAVGKYFHEYIGSYAGPHGEGSTTNRFFPAIGNHDWHRLTGYQGFTDYFNLPGNERYYDFTDGDAHFFIINSDPHEPDGRTPGSTQYQWLEEVMTASEATWKFVFMHHPPYSSSSSHGSQIEMQWPYHEWGATAVFAGHDHVYERLEVDGTVYFITGLGGMSKYGFGEPLPTTKERHNDTYGAMRVTYDSKRVTFEFWSVTNGGTKLDTHMLRAPAEKRSDAHTKEPAAVE